MLAPSLIENDLVVPPSRRSRVDALALAVKESLGEDAWLPDIYRARILTLRTRAFDLFRAAHGVVIDAHKPLRVEVQHTLLGVEIKIGKRRVLCPDFATARYLSIFARLGVREVAVPYDITQISRLADDLESVLQRTYLLVAHVAEDHTAQIRTRLQQTIVAEICREIEAAGAGTIVPQFNQSTKQRSSG